MLVTKSIEIDAGHRINFHNSKCKNVHGHRYKIIVGVDDKVITTPGVSDFGMVIDFSDLKEIMTEEIDAKFDHGFIMYDQDPLFHTFVSFGLKLISVPFVPTAENLAKHWYNVMKEKLLERAIKIKYVEVYETPTSTARYEE